MASGLFTLLDDIASLMDEVASMSKVATQKTAGLLADDLAVNAEKASGRRQVKSAIKTARRHRQTISAAKKKYRTSILRAMRNRSTIVRTAQRLHQEIGNKLKNKKNENIDHRGKWNYWAASN